MPVGWHNITTTNTKQIKNDDFYSAAIGKALEILEKEAADVDDSDLSMM